jgi:hypothetical protein
MNNELQQSQGSGFEWFIDRNTFFIHVVPIKEGFSVEGFIPDDTLFISHQMDQILQNHLDRVQQSQRISFSLSKSYRTTSPVVQIFN